MDAVARRALILCVCSTTLLPLAHARAETAPCQAGHLDTRGRVRSVFDGDTIRVQLPGMGSTRVRLAGINAPEVRHGDTAAQPGGAAARRALRGLLANHGDRVGLRVARQRRDRYGRLLAHVYLGDGTNVQAWLLRKGLAAHHATPPNLAMLACYRGIDRRARHERRGMWHLRRYRVRHAGELTVHTTGYQRVRGRVSYIHNSRRSVWLGLESGMSLRIDRGDLEHFDLYELAAFAQRSIRVRGWVHAYRGHPYMRVRHPSALEPAR